MGRYGPYPQGSAPFPDPVLGKPKKGKRSQDNLSSLSSPNEKLEIGSQQSFLSSTSPYIVSMSRGLTWGTHALWAGDLASGEGDTQEGGA